MRDACRGIATSEIIGTRYRNFTIRLGRETLNDAATERQRATACLLVHQYCGSDLSISDDRISIE